MEFQRDEQVYKQIDDIEKDLENLGDFEMGMFYAYLITIVQEDPAYSDLVKRLEKESKEFLELNLWDEVDGYNY